MYKRVVGWCTDFEIENEDRSVCILFYQNSTAIPHKPRPVLRRRAEQILCTAEFSGAPFPYIAREELFSLCRRRPLSAPGDGPNNADCEVDENLVHWHV